MGLLLVVGCRNETPKEAAHPFHRYPVERGHIQYRYGGDFRGTEDLYFDQWGMREARIADFEELMPSEIRRSKDVKITRGAMVYQLNPITKHGLITHDRLMDSLIRLPPDQQPKPEDYSSSILLKMDHKRTGVDTIAGFPVERWEGIYGGPKVWEWKGIVLKRIFPGKESTQEATATIFDTTWVVDTSVFVVPKDVRYQTSERRF